jgi:ABC-2 type transport system permease protein
MGTIIGCSLKDMQGFQLVMNFLVMPIFFLSGALYPLANLPDALTVLTHLDPLAYGVDGLRGAFIGRSHFGIAVDLAVLGGLAALFLALGARSFSRVQV